MTPDEAAPTSDKFKGQRQRIYHSSADRTEQSRCPGMWRESGS